MRGANDGGTCGRERISRTAIESPRRTASQILETAKTDALAKANEAVEGLNALGFKYALTDLTPKPKAKATTTGNKREPSGNECGYCHFKTVPPHDKRSHRTQKKKRPFTDAELKELGMVKA